MSINIEDYTDLAHFYANRSNKRNLQGIELDDLYQVAMIGIWEASLVYDSTQGKFTTFAHHYIEGEITNLIYKQVTIKNERTRLPRITEELYADISEMDIDMSEQLLHEDDSFDADFMDVFIEGLTLTPKHMSYFYEMITHGATDATARYMEVTGVTRQRAEQVRRDIRKKASKHYGRLA